jgi:hypothetical protein
MRGGEISPQAVADMCLDYMSEDDVEEMCRQNDLSTYMFPDEEDDDS